MLVDVLKVKQSNSSLKIKNKPKENKNDTNLNTTLKGLLVNKNIKANNDKVEYSFSEIQDTLLICDKPSYYSIPKEETKDEKDSSFDAKKAMIPLIVGTSVLCAGILGVSSILKKSSKNLLNTKSFEHLPDLAVNMNIKEEPHFALYRAIRDPNFKNIFGAAAVFVMSGVTLISKNFVEGAKEIWLKKKEADIEKELQENLIEVETQSFSGKLRVVNELLNSNVKYFDSVLNKTETKEVQANIFAGFPSFRGSYNIEKSTVKSEKERKEQLKNVAFFSVTAGVLIGSVLLGKLSLYNLRKTAQYSDKFANDVTEKTIDVINDMSKNAQKADIPTITELLKSICAKPDFVKEIGKKYNLDEKEIQSIISAVEETKKTIFADAPTSLGGIPKKIQYYCYIDENRGHLYNWILNPENKFTKYIFGAFTISSAIGYLVKQGMDAIKELTVMKENAKTELDLRKRLVDVEIKNFKSKKESAINPLIDNFKKQVENGNKSKDELKQLADNILIETKNGPPYVYA